MKGIVSWFAENHVAANLLMILIIVAGVATGLRMKVEIFPEVSLDRISVTVEYPGASPSEVEEGVVKKIEDQVAGLSGIKEITSRAQEGMGTVVIEAVKDWDIKKLLDDVKASVDRITTFPEEAEKPVVQELTRQHRVISLAVYGRADESTLKEVARRIKEDITSLPGITLAELSGTRAREIHVEIKEETLRRYGLTLGMVAEAIRDSSLDLPAGRIKAEAKEILIRTKGRKYLAREFQDIPVITSPDGSKVTLGDIATIREGFQDVDVRVRFQGLPGVIIQVYRIADQNALDVADKVFKYLEEIKPTLPHGIHVDTYQDRSKNLRSRIRLLVKNMSYGLVLVSILLGLFLDLRLAFWVAVGIPVSFLAGLMVLPHLDVSINMISLFAFIMVLGIVVDDAIIVGENVFRRRASDRDPLKASVEGALEVGRPVIFSVLTTVAAFWPLLLGSGTMGKFMRNIPLVVMVVIMGSLVESLLILPSHLAMCKPRDKKEKFVTRLLLRFVQGPYKKVLGFCVRWRYATLAAAIAVILLSAGLWSGGVLKFIFFPKVESDVLICNITMPVGTPFHKTVGVVERIEKAAREAMAKAEASGADSRILEYVASLVGFQVGGHMTGVQADSGGHLAQVFVQLVGSEEREVSAVQLARMWRKEVGEVPDVESLSFHSTLFSAGTPIEIHLSMEDHQSLIKAAELLKEELRKIPGLFDIGDSFLPGKDEVQLKLRPEAETLGLKLQDLARQVRHAFYGAEALRFQRDQEEIKVLVRYPEEERRELQSLEDMRIKTPSGHMVPFREVALVNTARGYAAIERVQRKRVIRVTADVDEQVANAHEVRVYLEQEFLPRLKGQFPGLRYSIEGEGKRQKESMADVITGFSIAIFAIYALLAVPLRSFAQPLVIMLAIPFSLVGALLGHLVMGLSLSLLSLFGMVGLAGVAVNDSLVLLHAINRTRRQGMRLQESVLQGGMLRFRAIILTSLTTFAGLMPLILEKSLQAQFLIPMAVSLGFGILFATGITLLLVPCGYMILGDILALRGLFKGVKRVGDEPRNP